MSGTSREEECLSPTGCPRLVSAALFAMLATPLFAQIVPTVGPSLSDGSQSNLSPTLSVDLLAPQRAFIFDPTNSKLSSTALDPEVYASTLSTSQAETDTLLRDASQAGHLSPYAAGGSRLGNSFSGVAGSGGEGGATDSGMVTAMGTLAGSGSGSLIGTRSGNGPAMGSGDSYQSSWGAGSSFGSQAGASSWGTQRLAVGRLGEGHSPALEAGEGTRDNSPDPDGLMDSAGRQGGGLPRRTAAKSGTERETAERSAARTGPLETDTAGRSRRRTPTGVTEGGATGSSADSTRDAMSFLPQAAAAGTTLESSPFSAPGGNGELTFLHPDILAATAMTHSLAPGQAGGAGSDRMGQRYGRSGDNRSAYGRSGYGQLGDGSGLDRAERGTLETSSTHYGLRTQLTTGRSASGTRAAGRRTRLNQGPSGSEQP